MKVLSILIMILCSSCLYAHPGHLHEISSVQTMVPAIDGNSMIVVLLLAITVVLAFKVGAKLKRGVRR